MKNAYPIVSAIIIGLCLAKCMFNQYNYDPNLTTVFNNGTSIYFLQQGVYSLNLSTCVSGSKMCFTLSCRVPYSYHRLNALKTLGFIIRFSSVTH